jgi:hypothetical protein
MATPTVSAWGAFFHPNFDNVMMPPKSHILGTPNREG